MTVSLETILGALPVDRRGRIERRAEKLRGEDKPLQAALDTEDAEERALLSGPLVLTVFRDWEGLFRFRLASSSGVALVDSPPYPDKDRALKAAETFRIGVGDAQFRDETKAVA